MWDLPPPMTLEWEMVDDLRYKCVVGGVGLDAMLWGCSIVQTWEVHYIAILNM